VLLSLRPWQVVPIVGSAGLDLPPDLCLALDVAAARADRIFRRREWDFKLKSPIVEKSSQGVSGLEKLLTLGAVTQVAAATSSSLSK